MKLQAIARLGWIDEPTPVTPLDELAEQLGLAYLGVKRDDLCSGLQGGTKVRKLDYLLAAEPWRDAPAWAGLGAIGSGQLVALAAAADELGRDLHAHIFWEPVSDGVLDNLAYVATLAAKRYYYGGRVSMALRRPGLLLARKLGDAAVVPPGASNAIGLVGLVRAGLELGEQIREGELPKPDEVHVAYGTGGTAAGLSVGLALAGVDTVVRAVAVVELVFTTRSHLRGLQRELLELLVEAGVEGADGLRPTEVIIERSALGRGYGITTPASRAACRTAAEHGLRLEPIYTGKAMAALLAACGGDDGGRGGDRKVLLWNTLRRDPLPITAADDSYRSRLPAALRDRLERPAAHRRKVRRRQLMLGAAAIVGLLGYDRCSGYRRLQGWQPRVLAGWEVRVLRAVAEVVLAPFASPEQLDQVPQRVDSYLVAMPAELARELHLAFFAVEHATTAFGVSVSRLTRAGGGACGELLERLRASDTQLRQAYVAMRDLCMLGYYQQPSSWPEIGFEGPQVPPTDERQGSARMEWPTYDELIAPPGTLPKGAGA